MGMLEGKVAIVTGGSQGIGAAIVEQFYNEGATVYCFFSSKADNGDGHVDALLEKLRKIGKCGILTAINVYCDRLIANDIDFSSKHAIKNILYHVNALKKVYGKLDILVNNAGTLQFTPYDLVNEDLWDRTHAVNLKVPFFLTQGIAEQMKKNDANEYGLRGSVINISSISAKRGGMLQHHYCPTKAGLESLVACFSESLGPHGIRVNGIAPGTIVTNINKEQLEADKEGTEVMRRNIPLQRLGTPEDVAQVALFLANDAMSRYVNGAIIDVNGGWHNVLAGQSK